MNETPMRPKFFIKDEKMVELIKQIFEKVDQDWYDVQAFDVYLLLKDFMERK